MALESISKQNIGDMVYKQFENAIITGEWPQGKKIPSENELAGVLGVSRVSVKSALHKLASLGLVESRRGEGTFVCNFSGAQYFKNLIPIIALGKPEMKYLLEFRMIFDCEIAGLAAQRADNEIISKLRKNLDEHKKLKDNIEKAAICDLDFHFLIAQGTENPLLEQIYHVLKDVFITSLYSIVAIMGTNNAYIYHQKIIDAISERNVEEAKSIMAKHLKDTINAVMEDKQTIAD